jgi:hypothetical protein
MKSQLIHSPDLTRLAKRRILVVANETLEATTLRDLIDLPTSRESAAEVLVVVPALNSRLRYWLSDEDGARRDADLRLAESLDCLHAAGIEAAGRIGDPDPVQAIGDALREFGAQQIVIPRQRKARPHWLARDAVERARRRFALPVVAQPTECPVLDAHTERSPRKQRPQATVVRCAGQAGS